VDDRILAIGGFDDANTTNAVESRALSGSGEWRDVAPMSMRRDNFAVVALDGRVHVIGGVDEHEHRLAGVEIYDPRADRWTPGRELPKRRAAASAAVLGGLVYVAGGALNSNSPTATVVVFDPRTGGWRSAAEMGTARAQLRLVASGQYLYAVGGRGTGASLTVVERYDPASDSWRTLSPMRDNRAAAGVVATAVRNRRVLVAVAGAVFGEDGGFVEGRRTTEVYDIERDTWTTLEVLLPEVRASQGCVVDGDGAVLAIGGGTATDGVTRFLRDVDALSLR
jgi:N-acetylneuraminic acid mutarotase